MQTSSLLRNFRRRTNRALRLFVWRARVSLLLSVSLLSLTAGAQTLARPNWAGSGMSAEAWWRTAVFYRIHVGSFQDSDGDGVGDLRGVAQRLDYLQSLGVDALVLEPPFDEAGFDDLLREASRRHIRLAVAISLAEHPTPAAVVVEARSWLTRGVAGLDIVPALNSAATVARFDAAAMHALRSLTDSFPGQRVLMAERVSGTVLAPAPDDGRQAQLVDAEVNYVPAESAATFAQSLRHALAQAQNPNATSEPWLVTDDGYRSALAYDFANDRLRSLGTKKVIATMLFAARGATDLLFGQELGLNALDLRTTMQWTPSNVTRAKAAPVAETKPAAAGSEVFGVYKAYVAPKPILTLAPAFDPNGLDGFSVKSTGSAADASSHNNAAEEDRDPQSLLNFYRKLGQLHHGSATLRNGVMHLLDRDDDQALLWIRRAPANARTAASIVVACNLGPRPIILSVRDDLARLRLSGTKLRPLLASWTESPAAQTTDRIEVPAYGVYIGELGR